MSGSAPFVSLSVTIVLTTSNTTSTTSAAASSLRNMAGTYRSVPSRAGKRSAAASPSTAAALAMKETR
jgi:hypothetical protein